MSSINIMAGSAGSTRNCNRQRPVVQDRPSHVIRKVAKEDFRGTAPFGLLSALFAWPSNTSELHIELEDAMVRRTLDNIRDRCQVWIDCFLDEGYIVISARKIQNVRSGLQEIREWMLVQAKELEDNTTTLVHRIGGSPCSCILLKLTLELGLGSGITDGWRGVAQAGSAEDKENSSSIPGGYVVAAQLNDGIGNNQVIAYQLLDAIKQTARLIRPALGRKYVRVHLGLRSLSKRKAKDRACDEYTTSQFRTLMSSATKRGHVSFRLCFGGGNLTQTILRHIHKTDNLEDPAIRRFVALDATIDRLRDVKTCFCLVFFSGNFRIEMDILVEHCKLTSSTTSRRANRLNLPTASSPRIFRFKKTVDAEIAVACPDMKVDWQLSVDSDLSADKVHERFRILAKELHFDPVPEDGLTFPVAHASCTSLRKANIDSAAGKATWTLECLKAPCRIDFTEYYDWDAHPVSNHMDKNPHVDLYSFSIIGRNCPIPNKSCAVSLYGEDWDEKMRTMNPASGRFADELINLFGCGVDGEQYIKSMLQEIEFLLNITTQAVAETESLLGIQTQSTREVGPVLDAAVQAATVTEDIIDFTA